LTEADGAVRAVRDRFRGTPSADLLPQVRSAVTELRRQIDLLSTLTSAARRGAALLPTMLAASGSRTYLLAFQNLAEKRATGGMLGAYVTLRVSDGRVTVLRQGNAIDLLVTGVVPVLPLDRATRALYGDLIGIYPADVNLSPHFPTAATMYREMYRRRFGVAVDGVLATDPVAVSYLLRATGPVPVRGAAPLAATTVVRTLLSDAYRFLPASTQDAYYASSARAVLDVLLSRTVDPRLLLPALDQALTERRLLFWSAHPDEQAAIAETRLAGILPEREDTSTVGVFLNDGSGAKLGYYLTHTAELTVGDCRPDGRRELRLRVTLGSTAPRSGLSPSVLGLRMAGNPYTARTLVNVFSPAGGSVLDARLDGAPVGVGGGTERGRRVAVATVDVPAGQARVLDVTLLTPVTTSGLADLRVTPGVQSWPTRITTARTCDR
ncbi:DUF4012 domain-containing protein, partial [Micromonospora zhanjiangensis]